MIERWHNIDKKSNKEIAELLDKSERTIRREIKRGLVIVKGYMWEDIEEYSAKIAQRKYDYNKTGKGPELKLDKELSNDEQRNEVLLEIELTNNKIDNEKKKRKKLMDGYLNGIFDNDDYIASKEEINTAIQKLEDYKSELEKTAKTPASTLTDRINDLKKLISNKMYNEGEKISHGLIHDVVDSIVVEEDHFEWKFNIFNYILKLNLEGKKN